MPHLHLSNIFILNSDGQPSEPVHRGSACYLLMAARERALFVILLLFIDTRGSCFCCYILATEVDHCTHSSTTLNRGE